MGCITGKQRGVLQESPSKMLRVKKELTYMFQADTEITSFTVILLYGDPVLTLVPLNPLLTSYAGKEEHLILSSTNRWHQNSSSFTSLHF